jgi:REP element-mobilizing transposase RayT
MSVGKGKSRQRSFEFRTWGGKRKNAGRKRSTEKRRVAHVTRARLDGRTPVHVTLRMRPDIARLRKRKQYRVLRNVFVRTAERDGFRICHYSIQSNHVHLICEPRDEVAMARGMIAFKTSCARRLNALAGRRGAVFGDRYHARYLRTPMEVRRALSYVLNNWRHHGEDRGVSWAIDPFSSAGVFDGWAGAYVRPPPREGERCVAPPAFWLLTTGWRRHGAIGLREVPRGAGSLR